MDETKIVRPPASTHTTINRTQTKPSGSGNAIWFLMGGVVVVVAIIAYFLMGEGPIATSGVSQPEGGNVSINVDTNDAQTGSEPSAPAAAPAETTPAPAQTETAPLTE